MSEPSQLLPQTLPRASLTTQGTVMLNDTINSFSTSLAATANSVRIAYNNAYTAMQLAQSASKTQWSDYASNIYYNNGSVGIATTSFDISYQLYVNGGIFCNSIKSSTYDNLPVATTSTHGIVRLENDLYSISTDRAPTALALNTVYQTASRIDQSLKTIFGGGDVTTGFTELKVNKLIATKYVGIPTSSNTVAGLVKLSDAITRTDSTCAASSFAVKQINDKVSTLTKLWNGSAFSGASVRANYEDIVFDAEYGNVKCVSLACANYINLPLATSETPGIVTLSDSVINADPTQAASSMAVMQLNDKISLLSNQWTRSGDTITYVGNVGINTSVLPSTAPSLYVGGDTCIDGTFKLQQSTALHGVYTYLVDLPPTGISPLVYTLMFQNPMRNDTYTVLLTPQSTESLMLSCVVRSKSSAFCVFNVYSVSSLTNSVAAATRSVQVNVLVIES